MTVSSDNTFSMRLFAIFRKDNSSESRFPKKFFSHQRNGEKKEALLMEPINLDAGSLSALNMLHPQATNLFISESGIRFYQINEELQKELKDKTIWRALAQKWAANALKAIPPSIKMRLKTEKKVVRFDKQPDFHII